MIFRKYWLIAILLSYLTAIIIGVLTQTGSVLSIYDDFGIGSSFDRPTGFLWDILWFWRGQPAGWEANPDSWFNYNTIPIIGFLIAPVTTVHKTDIAALLGEDRGMNGPLTLWGFATEWFVDATIYMPKFLDVGWVAVNGDIILPAAFKFAFDFALLIGFMAFLIIILPILGIFIGYMMNYLLQFIAMMTGPVLKILLILFFVWGIITIFTGGTDWMTDLFPRLMEAWQ